MKTNGRACEKGNIGFSKYNGFHQGSALNPFLFATLLNDITQSFQGNMPGCMLFFENIVLLDH